jgi:hypothetical protein
MFMAGLRGSKTKRSINHRAGSSPNHHQRWRHRPETHKAQKTPSLALFSLEGYIGLFIFSKNILEEFGNLIFKLLQMKKTLRRVTLNTETYGLISFLPGICSLCSHCWVRRFLM